MAFLQRTMNRGSVSTGYDVDNSCKFEDANSEGLHKSLSSQSQDCFTISFWLKRTALGAQRLVGAGSDGNNEVIIHFTSSDQLEFYAWESAYRMRYKTNRVFRDTSAWYHFAFLVDTRLSTASERTQLYVNGVLETSFAAEVQPGLNGQFPWTTNVYVGKAGAAADSDMSGYLSEFVYLDDTKAAHTDLGEFDSDTGIWKPIDVSGLTFGTNGAYLDFKDSSNLGNDANGGTDFTETNITSADQSTDTPTNNFCTWSPLWAESRANGTITEGATQVAWGGGAWKIARSSMAVSKGRWYWEIKAANVTGDTWNNNLFGFASVDGEDGQYGPTVLLGYSTGNYYYRVANSQTGQDNWGNSGGAWSSSDTFGFALDLESSTKKFILYRNGSAVNGSGTDLVSAFQTEQFFTPYSTSYNGDTQFLNWGGYTVNTISTPASDENGYGTFEYAPPSGYYALCGKNLAEFGGTA